MNWEKGAKYDDCIVLNSNEFEVLFLNRLGELKKRQKKRCFF